MFHVGQRVMISPDADKAAGCIGIVVRVNDDTCDVRVFADNKHFTGEYLHEHLLPVQEHV